LETCPKTVVEEPPLVRLRIIIALFQKAYVLLQILLKCGFRVVYKFFNRNVQKPVFLPSPFGRLSCNSIKTYWNIIHSIH